MTQQSENSDNQAFIGCGMLALIVFGGTVIIQVLHTVMYTVVVLGAVGGVGYLVYKINIYDNRTGNITAWFERTFDLNKRDERLDLPSGKDEILGLPQEESTSSALLDELESMKDQVEV